MKSTILQRIAIGASVFAAFGNLQAVAQSGSAPAAC